MQSRLRFTRKQIAKAFNLGWKAQKSMSKVTIDPDLLDRISQQDQAAVDELIDEIDRVIAKAFSGPPKSAAPTKATSISTTPSSDGMNCDKCNNFIQYAVPNQPDGKLICYSCRS